MKKHLIEIQNGERFEFGANWTRFLSVLDDERISEAENSLKFMLGLDQLKGKKFLDVGSGSGLFSLAACRLNAKVYSFDYDPLSVNCTSELKLKYFPNKADWEISEGSILEKSYLKQLGQFDIVYSWGVLHHTGSMWEALDNIVPLVKKGGFLYIAIYNDQGRASKAWLKVKKIFCSGIFGKILVKCVFYPYFASKRAVADLIKMRNPFTSYAHYKKSRGMSVIHDWQDWLGGYPFEVAKPEEVFEFFQKKDFILKKLKTCAGGLGCNEFIFTKL
jgi:2-polyprenyl-3-methyl-5-hydroxy-6-metoxy-1,4-benzoquinol methylase